MPKYIDGEKLRNRISAEYTNCTKEFVKGFSEAFRLWNEEVEKMMNESADVQEVKHGTWISVEDDVLFECSVCGCEISTSWNYDQENMWEYCPHCGAKMDEPKI